MNRSTIALVLVLALGACSSSSPGLTDVQIQDGSPAAEDARQTDTAVDGSADLAADLPAPLEEWIYFSRHCGGASPQSGLYRMRPDGTMLEQYRFPVSDAGTISVEGKPYLDLSTIVYANFVKIGSHHRRRLFFYNVQTQTADLVPVPPWQEIGLNASFSEPDWEPDGKGMVFALKSPFDSTTTEHIARLTPPDPTVTLLTSHLPGAMPGQGDAKPACSPDGKHIAFQSRQNVPLFYFAVDVIEADGSNRKRLAVAPGIGTYPSWTQDNRVIYTRTTCADGSVQGCADEIVVQSPTDPSQLQIISLPEPLLQVSQVQQSPDGQKMLLSTRTTTSGWELWIIDGDGSNPERLTQQTECADGSLILAWMEGSVGRGPAGAPRTTSDPSIGGGSQCDLVALTEQIAKSENSVPPVNCGVAILTDPLWVWEAISSCLKKHLVAEDAFYGAFQLQSDEVNRLGFGMIGIKGPPFVFKQIIWDSDPSSGWDPNAPPRAEIFRCQVHGVDESCAPSAGYVCMGCFDNTRDVSDLCPGWPQPF